MLTQNFTKIEHHSNSNPHQELVIIVRDQDIGLEIVQKSQTIFKALHFKTQSLLLIHQKDWYVISVKNLDIQ